MTGLLEVFLIIWAIVIVLGIPLSFLPEMASLIGCAVLVYGTVIVWVVFLIIAFCYDHISINFTAK